MNYSMVELIREKRDGRTLDPDALRWIIEEYTADRIPDYQLSSLLMAIVFNGMSPDELSPWTEAMLQSGEVLDLSEVSKPKVDKHSTGGVGDKISIPLAPIVAACGVAVPMMSGRGLGHTGGTLDKLESISGFTTAIEPSAFNDQLEDIGVVMAGQTETLVPADRRIYELRNATGTVPSVPLISSSIMSKKLAEDLDGLLLDVKVGNGAFMKTIEDATTLAETMVGIGTSRDTPVTAILTNMSQPLGRAVGNANEIAESVAILKGGGPEDVRTLTLRFAMEMLLLAGEASVDSATARVLSAIESGAALETMFELTARQGGDPAVIENTDLLPHAAYEYVVTASRPGIVSQCNAFDIGAAAVRLGAGRATKEEDIDPAVGFLIEAKVGDRVDAGDPLARIAYNDETKLQAALHTLDNAWEISDETVAADGLILGKIR
ncbi:MAG: pyrimidine-nucleoside phosphorylase [Acidimicrobiia bacterium]|nr:MAG: pyrimidine-nucleoside phosphorylase [Acidimicrobiia bacterium]